MSANLFSQPEKSRIPVASPLPLRRSGSVRAVPTDRTAAGHQQVKRGLSFMERGRHAPKGLSPPRLRSLVSEFLTKCIDFSGFVDSRCHRHRRAPRTGRRRASRASPVWRRVIMLVWQGTGRRSPEGA